MASKYSRVLSAALGTAVPAERAGGSELTKLVTDHVLLHEHLQELVAVVDLEGVAHEFRDDRAGARPGPDGLLGPVLVQLLHLAVDLLVYEGALFCASAHSCCPCGPSARPLRAANTRSLSNCSRSADAAGACRTCG